MIPGIGQNNGALDHVFGGGSENGGKLGGLGQIGQLLDPFGLLGGNNAQSENGMSSEEMLGEFQNMLDDFLKDLMAQLSEKMGSNVDTGSGDDQVNIGSEGAQVQGPQQGCQPGPPSGPINIDTGSGNDTVNIGSGDAGKSITDSAHGMETHTDTGSGNDSVNIHAEGNHSVELGSGDDQAYVDFGDGSSGNSATIIGGSGEDSVTLAGSKSDYTSSQEDGYTTYTDRDGNNVQVSNDVENVKFEKGIDIK